MTLAGMVARERRRLRLSVVAEGTLAALGVSAIVVAAASAGLGGARWLVLPRGAPALVWAVVAGVVVYLAIRTRRRLVGTASRQTVAHAIEVERGLRRGTLLGVMELEGQGALATRAVNATRAALPATAPLAPATRRRASRRVLASAAVGLGGGLLLAVVTPAYGDGLRAVLHPIAAWRGALLPPVRVLDVPRDAVRGDSAVLRIIAPGRARLYITRLERGLAARTDTLILDSHALATRWSTGALRGDLRLVVEDGRSTSDSLHIRVVDRPFVGGVQITVTFPRYLGRSPEQFPAGEPLVLPRGAEVAISGHASVRLTGVTLAGPRGEQYALSVSGYDFAGRLLATRSSRLRWNAFGVTGTVAELPPPLELTVLPDSAPQVAILAPSGDTLAVNADTVTLSLAASDDHGIASVALRATHGGVAGSASTVTEVAGASGARWQGDASIPLASLRLAPGDVARLRAEVVDASPWAQRGVSREIVIRRATLDERRDTARALGAQAVRDARAAASAQRVLAQRTDDAARDQTRAERANAAGASAAHDAKTPMNFGQAERARALVQEQRAMAERVKSLRESTQRLQEQLRAAGALDSALARRLGEAQALLRQALSPQMLAQMQTLEQAAQRLDGEQSRDALRDLAQQQQRMRDQLERSAEILKRAADEGAMQTLADEARDLAQRQRSAADSAHATAKLSEQAHRLGERMTQLAERLVADKAEAGATRTEQAGEHAQKSETEMRRAGRDAQRGDAGESAQRGREAAGEMEQAASAMRDARAQQVNAWKRELTTELDQSVQEMLQLAREERALEQHARGASGSGAEQRGAQSAVEQGVDKATERLQGAAKKSALLSARSQRAMSDARERVSQATRKLAPGSGGGTGQQASALGEAADALTQAAAALARDRERANSASSASGLSEMLREMQQAAERQGRINGQAQSLMSMPGGPAGGAAQQLARSLARQQRGVADQLEDAGDAAGGAHAAQLAQEARQLADQLDGGRLDGATLARQQQLFRRLLDAGRALEKDDRDDSGKRESRTAAGGAAFAPGAAAPSAAAQRYRPPTWDEMRGLSADERRAILAYFARLNNAPPR